MSIERDGRVLAEVDGQPYPLLFATVSGAHLYGFASPDSDCDIRGVHILPVREVVGLDTAGETIEVSEVLSGLEMDLVTHDIRKFFQMLLRKNGYVLEQLYSPLVVHTTPGHEELKQVARGCITRYHSHHYLGFSRNEWELFYRENPRRIKPLLYVFRVLLTGIHLMRTGEVEANILNLKEEYRLPYLDDLIEKKRAEQSLLGEDDLDFFEGEYRRLTADLELESSRTLLPDSPQSRDALNDLLIRLRLTVDRY